MEGYRVTMYTKKFFKNQMKKGEDASHNLFIKNSKGRYVFNPKVSSDEYDVILWRLRKNKILAHDARFFNWISRSSDDADSGISFTNVFAFIGKDESVYYLTITAVDTDKEFEVRQYLISWDESTENIKAITMNGKYIKLGDYVDLCNLLEELDFYDKHNWKFYG